jgi:hypothetical protein
MAEPGIPVPLIPLALGAPPSPSIIPTMYQEYYNTNDAYDTARGNYEAIMATFIIPVVGAPPPQQVSDIMYALAIKEDSS